MTVDTVPGGLEIIQVGVIGAGYWGRKVINEYYSLSQKDPGVRLRGVCDALPSAIERCRDGIRIELVCSDYSKFLQSPDIDAVHICTPNETHYEICKEALEGGKHVLVEKPLTLDSDEAYELIELAERRGLVLSVGHIFRFNNALLKLRKLIGEGRLGKVSHLRLEWTTLMEPPEGRDIITDLGPHPFDIINFLLDDWPLAVRCTSHTCRKGREELAYIDVELDDGVTAHIELSWLLPGKTRRVSVLGSERIGDCDCLNQVLTVHEDGSSSRLDLEANNTIETELGHFISSIRNNGLDNGFKVENSGLIGARTVELLKLSRLSQERRDWVRLSDEPPRSPRYAVLNSVKSGEGTRIYDQVNLYKCEIGRGCKVDAFVYIEEGVKIGNNCKIRALTFIPTGVTIEDDVFIGPNVTFTNDKHPRASGEWVLLPTLVKRGASIGAHSVILPGVVIGENAMVGAGSVVTKDVPDNAVVAGNPARILERAPATNPLIS